MKQYAFISDIHGNSFALSAVLRDIEQRGIGTIYNLDDSLFGSLDPHGTLNVTLPLLKFPMTGGRRPIWP